MLLKVLIQDKAMVSLKIELIISHLLSDANCNEDTSPNSDVHQAIKVMEDISLEDDIL